MKKWAIDQVERMRESRKETNTDIGEHIAQFISTLPGRLIITKHFNDARAKIKETPMEMLRAPAVGRVCIDDRKVYITAKTVNDWCKDHGVAPTTMKEELDKGGYLIYAADGSPSIKCYIGSGSTIPSGQARCYEFKYGKLFGGSAPLNLVETNGGVATENLLETE
jgi:hypothetical protein